MLCLTETWLLANYQGLRCGWNPILNCVGQNLMFFAKSSMENSTDSYNGRPFGGIAVIPRKHMLLYVEEIECISDRIIAVVYSDNQGNIVQVLCNVYMPFYYTSNRTQNCTLRVLMSYKLS